MTKPLLALGVCLLAAGAYAPSLGNGFVWDDPIILTRQLPIFRTAGAVLSPPRDIPQFAPDYYRPLVIASYLIDQKVGGGAPWLFHLTVVIAHALTAVVVLFLGDLLFLRIPGMTVARASIAAGIGAALFAVHPIHSEAVAWIAGRADVFAALFGAVAVYAHLRSQAEPRFAVVAAVAWLLALLSKEVAISLVGLFAAADALVGPRRPAAESRRRRTAQSPLLPRSNPLQRYAPLALSLVLYLALRWSAVEGGLSTQSGPSRGSLGSLVVAALGLYVRKLIWPWPLNAFIADLPVDVPSLLIGGLAALLLVVGAVLAWRRGEKVMAFLIAWVGLTLAPSLTILFKIPEVPIAERYLYLPSVGYCLLLGYALARGLRSASNVARFSAAGVVVVALAGGTTATVWRSQVWESDLALWEDTAAASPGAGMPMRSLGGALLKLGRIDEAKRTCEEALRRHNTDAGRVTLLSNLGTIELLGGNLDSAERFYRDAVAGQATSDGMYNLGVISLRRARAALDAADRPAADRAAAAALRDLARAESVSPHDPDIQLAVGQALLLLGREAEARQRHQRALDLGLTGPAAEQVRSLFKDRGD